jgi:hypothetical protein
MSRRVAGVSADFSMFLRAEDRAPTPISDSALIRDLIDGRIAIERLSDDTVAIRRADGSLQILSAEETAMLASLILRAAQEGGTDFRALMRLHDVAAGQQLHLDSEQDMATGSTDKPEEPPRATEPQVPPATPAPEGWVPPENPQQPPGE